MNNLPAQKSVIQPELTDVLMNLKQDIFATLNCHMPGIIQSFDATKCTAVVQPVFNRYLPTGKTIQRQKLVDCPVLFPGGGGGRLTFPIASGDQCLIFYADRRIDEWVTSGSVSTPADPRMHDMSDPIVLVGLDPTGVQGPVASDMVVLSYMGTEFKLTSAGWNFVSPGSAEIDLGTLVTIKNGTTTLGTILQNLVTALIALQVQGNLPITAATASALATIQTELTSLLV